MEHDRRIIADWIIDKAVDRAYQREECSDLTSGTMAIIQNNMDKEAQLINSLASLDGAFLGV